MPDTTHQLYHLAVKCKGRVRSSGWWSPWYRRSLREDVAALRRLFHALPEGEPMHMPEDQALNYSQHWLDMANIHIK